MKDLADEAKDDFALVMLADAEPVMCNPEEEAAGIETCEYCGHYPCGCGG